MSACGCEDYDDEMIKKNRSEIDNDSDSYTDEEDDDDDEGGDDDDDSDNKKEKKIILKMTVMVKKISYKTQN